MGCSVSKLERDEEVPGALGPVQRIIGRSRGRKGSISAAELLKPVELEQDVPVSEPQSPMSIQSQRLNTPREVEDCSRVEEVVKMVVAEKRVDEVVVVEEETKVEAEEAKCGELSSMVADDVGMPPGSPSFRFYFLEAAQASEDDDFVTGLVRKEDSKLEEIKEDHPPLARESSNESLTTSEEPEVKLVKKEKPKRFRALTRAPSAVFKGFFNVRSCYSSHSTIASAANVHESPQLIIGKAA